MPPKVNQATIIILDIGRNVSSDDKTKSFFDKARQCVSRIIERKILSQDMNFLVGVVLLGSKVTKNAMAQQVKGAFRHIKMLHELQVPTWQMIRDLPEQTTSSIGEWLDALVVAANHFKNEVSGMKIANKKVILMTNFQADSKLDGGDLEEVLNGYTSENIELDVIGPEIYDDSQKIKDIELLRKFVETTKGVAAPFEDIMNYLLFHHKKLVKPTPWNVDLSIGPNIKIPVSSYIRLKDEPVMNKWMKAVKDPITSTASTVEGIVRNKIHINTENHTVVEPSSVIEGYNYGQQIIPFSEHDRTMLYDSGEKCLSVYGFTHTSNVTWQNMVGDNLSYIFGRAGDKKAQHAIKCLVECLHELNLVGIVRRVYNKGNVPKMHVLMPVIDSDNYVCLSMAAICFKEEIKNMAFPPTNLKKYTCTDEQVNAFKDLIAAMDLTKAYDETYDEAEAFPIAETVSPSAQYILDCIAYRAMNPGKPLPQPRDDIMKLFKQPPLVEKRSREPLDKLKTLFTLKKVEVKTRRRRKSDSNFDNIPAKEEVTTTNQINTTIIDNNGMPTVKLPVKSDEIDRVGTINPIEDFKTLTDKGKSLEDLSPEMSESIEILVYSNLDGNYNKAIETMRFFRTKCVESNPLFYNGWLSKFKVALNDRKRQDILDLIVEKQLSFILKEENSLSTYDAVDDESQAYEYDTMQNTTDLTIKSEINNMFDDM